MRSEDQELTVCTPICKVGYMQYPNFYVKGTPNCKVAPDPEIFFPEPYGKGAGEISRRAKAVCEANGGCAYLKECLAWAVVNNEPGVWGGTSENERRKIRKDAMSRRYKSLEFSVTSSDSASTTLDTP